MLKRVVVALMLMALGCSDAVGVESDLLTAEISGARLHLTNRIAEPVYYFAVDNETAAVIDWAPCTDPQQCTSVPAGSTQTLRLADLHISENAASLVVFHWRLVPGGDPNVHVFDSVRTLTVTLP